MNESESSLRSGAPGAHSGCAHLPDPCDYCDAMDSIAREATANEAKLAAALRQAVKDFDVLLRLLNEFNFVGARSAAAVGQRSASRAIPAPSPTVNPWL